MQNFCRLGGRQCSAQSPYKLRRRHPLTFQNARQKPLVASSMSRQLLLTAAKWGAVNEALKISSKNIHVVNGCVGSSVCQLGN